MPSCAFKKCFNHSGKKNKSHGITFHSFPKDEYINKKWIAVLQKQRQEPDWTPTLHSRICSIHFKPEVTYKTSKGLRKLKTAAVPYFQMIRPDETSTSLKDTTENEKINNNERLQLANENSPSANFELGCNPVKTDISEEPSTSLAGGDSTSKVQENVDDPLRISTTRVPSPSGLSDIGTSDLEGALDTPTVYYLKKQLKNREEVCKGHVSKIKNLQRMNKRLCARNKTLKLMLNKMKKKLMILMKRRCAD